jgi:hypothetical protein
MVFPWIFVVAIALIAVAAHRLGNSGRFAKPLNADDLVVEKEGSAARGKFWIGVLYSTGVGCLSLWFGYIGMSLHYDATRPTKPDAAKGAIISQSNHGHIVYLTDREERLLLSLQRSSMGFAFISVLATYFYKRTTGKMPR